MEFYILLAIGVALIVLEMSIGFAVFWYLCVGLAFIMAALTSLYIPGWQAALWAITLYSILNIAVVFLWFKPRFMPSKGKPSHDMIGQTAQADTDILPGKAGGKLTWSGVQWSAQLNPEKNLATVTKGQFVRIVSVAGITLFVEPTQPTTAQDPKSTTSPVAQDSESGADTTEPPDTAGDQADGD